MLILIGVQVGNDIELSCMTLKQYLAIMTLATILCWIAFGFVIVNVDPFSAGLVSFLFFYMSAYLAMLGTLSILLFAVHRAISGEIMPLFRSVEKSFRAAALLSFAATALLYFQARNWLRLWNLIIFILAVFFIAIYSLFRAGSFSRSQSL